MVPIRQPDLVSALATLAMIVSSWSCTQREAADDQAVDSTVTNESTATSSDAPSRVELENATYGGVEEQPVTLSGGEWQGDHFDEGGASRPTVGLVRDFQLTADLNGDGAEEEAVLLWTSSGGSGTFNYLAVMGRTEGNVTNMGTAELGDRVKIRSAEVIDKQIVLNSIETGPDDAACCPGQKMLRTFALTDGVLNEVATDDLGRMSVADLGGTEWVLTHFTWDDLAPPEPEITLIFADNGIVGFSGCNRYNSEVTEGEMPGDLSVGLIAGTRMACPDDLNDLESRFLQALESVNQYSFVAAKLVLSWSREDVWNTMLFVPRPLPEAEN